jgi:hypothetical protein
MPSPLTSIVSMPQMFSSLFDFRAFCGDTKPDTKVLFHPTSQNRTSGPEITVAGASFQSEA